MALRQRSKCSRQMYVPRATAVSGSAQTRVGRPVCSAEKAIESAQQRAAAGQHQAVVDQVGGQIGAALVERGLDGVDDLQQRRAERLANLLAGDRGLARQAADRVDAAHFVGQLFFQRIGAADVDPQPLGGARADAQAVVPPEIVDDGLVHGVAAHADRLLRHDVAQAEHGHFGRAAADVADHAGHGLGDRQRRADRGGLGLGHDEHLASAGPLGAVVDGPLFDRRDAAGHGHQHARLDAASRGGGPCE